MRRICMKLGILFSFLVSLDEEKETFLKDELSEDEYVKAMGNLVDNTMFVSTAWRDGRIVGVDGLGKKKWGDPNFFWPIVRGYTVVDKLSQGLGIG